MYSRTVYNKIKQFNQTYLSRRWVIKHDCNTPLVNFTCWINDPVNMDMRSITPDSVVVQDPDTLVLEFNTAYTGHVVIG